MKKWYLIKAWITRKIVPIKQNFDNLQSLETFYVYTGEEKGKSLFDDPIVKLTGKYGHRVKQRECGIGVLEDVEGLDVYVLRKVGWRDLFGINQLNNPKIEDKIELITLMPDKYPLGSFGDTVLRQLVEDYGSTIPFEVIEKKIPGYVNPKLFHWTSSKGISSHQGLIHLRNHIERKIAKEMQSKIESLDCFKDGVKLKFVVKIDI